MSHSTDVTLVVGLDTYNFHSGSRKLAETFGIACWDSMEFTGRTAIKVLNKCDAFKDTLGTHRYHFMVASVENEVEFIQNACSYYMEAERELDTSIKLKISHQG